MNTAIQTRPVSADVVPEALPDTDRALEITLAWGDTVLETLSVTKQPVVTLGDKPHRDGWGPVQWFVPCDLQVPSRSLPEGRFPLAVSLGGEATNYQINLPSDAKGRIERADGTVMSLQDLIATDRTIEPSDVDGAKSYQLRSRETLFLQVGATTIRMRYVWKKRFHAPPFIDSLDHTWLNILILALFTHALAVVAFTASGRTSEDLFDELFKNRNRFAAFKLKLEEKKPQPSLLLAQLKQGKVAPKHANKDGKAGRKDYKGPQGRMAVRGNPDDEELAKSALKDLLGVGSKAHRSYLFGTGGLGGELKSALGGVTGAQIGDATGLGGLGTRGEGPGGGGVSFGTVGLGALGTHGRGGGDGGYGSGVGKLGTKSDRGINISMGDAVVMGSLDRELIRKVIQEHIAQIRYCYEKELQRTPGLHGKIGTEFIIEASGRVQSATAKQNTLGSSSVELCVLSKIRTWQFPQPKGGGIVVVRYPFVFTRSG